MKRFLIDTSVENAEGTQTWFVDAETEQEALDKFSSGNCDLYESNVEVTRCGEPEISGEVPLDDFGRFAEQPPAAQPSPTVQEPVVMPENWFSGMPEEYRKEAWRVANPPAAQPAVQEPIGYLFQHEETGLTTVVEVQQVEWGFEKNNPRHQKIGPVYATPPAPAVPDAITDDSESPEYRTGWNDCRQAMREMMK
jgi:hypothetical protein